MPTRLADGLEHESALGLLSAPSPLVPGDYTPNTLGFPALWIGFLQSLGGHIGEMIVKGKPHVSIGEQSIESKKQPNFFFNNLL